MVEAATQCAPPEYMTREYVAAFGYRTPFQVSRFGSIKCRPGNKSFHHWVARAVKMSGIPMGEFVDEVVAGVTVRRSLWYEAYREHWVHFPGSGPGHPGLYRIVEWDSPAPTDEHFQFEIRSAFCGLGTFRTLAEAKCALVILESRAGKVSAVLEELLYDESDLVTRAGPPVPVPTRPMEGRVMTATQTPTPTPKVPDRAFHCSGRNLMYAHLIAFMADVSPAAADEALAAAEGSSDEQKAVNAIAKITKTAWELAPLPETADGKLLTMPAILREGLVPMDQTAIWFMDTRFWIQVGEWCWFWENEAPFHMSEWGGSFRPQRIAVLKKGTLPNPTGYGNNKPDPEAKARAAAAAEAAKKEKAEQAAKTKAARADAKKTTATAEDVDKAREATLEKHKKAEKAKTKNGKAKADATK